MNSGDEDIFVQLLLKSFMDCPSYRCGGSGKRNFLLPMRVVVHKNFHAGVNFRIASMDKDYRGRLVETCIRIEPM